MIKTVTYEMYCIFQVDIVSLKYLKIKIFPHQQIFFMTKVNPSHEIPPWVLNPFK